MKRAETALRDYALGFPATKEEFPWGHTAIKVKGKAFLFMSNDDDRLSLSVKLPTSRDFALDLPFTQPTGYGLGKSGWITSAFGLKDRVPVSVLQMWIEESFFAIAPASLTRTLRGDAASPPARKTKRRKSAR
ncbi:MAG: MmcQ/YjbR family DNA-binding protein [Casimicrobiaceae bacterium]